MGFKVIWSDQAIEDLRGLCAYIARRDPEAALRMGNGILDHVHILASSLLLGRRILEERADRCGRSSFGRTAFSMM